MLSVPIFLQMAHSSADKVEFTTNMDSNSTNNFDLISQWRSQRLEFINRVADDALRNATDPETSVGRSLRELDHLLSQKLESEGAINDDDPNFENGDDYGGTDDDDASSFALPPQQLRVDSASRQLSACSLMNTVADQAIHIKRTHSKIYSCFKDKDNGVMALKNNELAYIDCVRGNNGTRQLKMRIVSLDDAIVEVAEEAADVEENNQNGFRVVSFPPEIENMHAADMEYLPFKSSYIIGLYTSYQANANGRTQRTSTLYLFDSADNEFEPWLPLAGPNENLGIVNRIYCCLKKPVIYVVVNNFGRSGLLALDQWGAILERQYASDLIPEYERAHFVDIACTGNNDLLAMAYNSSVNGQEGRMGVRLYDPTTWARIADLNLGLISVPFSVPRLA